MNTSNVEHIVTSLVREFLSRKKCKNTLALMDQELPRDSNSINNRSKLTEILHLQKWMAANKSMKSPMRSMLEVIVYNSAMLNKPSETDQRNTSTHLSSTRSANSKPRALRTNDSVSDATNVITKSVNKMELEEIDNSDLNSIDSCNLILEPTKILPSSSTVEEKKNKAKNGHAHFLSSKTKMGPLLKDMTFDDDFKMKNQQREDSVLKMLEANYESPKKRISRKIPMEQDIGNKIIEQNDLEQIFSIETVGKLRKLIFGSEKHSFSKEWIDQNFSFTNTSVTRSDTLRFGIVQNKGGPCGVLASVQAMMMKHLLTSLNKLNKDTDGLCLNVEDAARTSCLAEAIVDILWKAGSRKHAVLAVRTPRKQFETESWYRSDGVTEYIVILHFDDVNLLRKSVKSNIASYESGKGSCILLLYSAILSRGIENTKLDMMGEKLIERYNYCSQDMVNLILTGHATPNVFNGILSLDKDTKLTGISEQSEIGFLTIFEHYESCEVGSYYKSPKFPIWVVCSESHYSVLFGMDFNLQSKATFNLYYYDGLANQEELIKLSVDTNKKVNDFALTGDLVPPLEHCIRTKWHRASIDWNGSDPIL